MPLNPPDQYVDDDNLRARQRFWRHQVPYFDIVSWVRDLAGLEPGMRVLDAGCGNGRYLRALAERPVWVAGCDLSPGMLRASGHPSVACADVTALPFRDAAFDVVLAAHMLYHVPDRAAAVRELRRVLAPGGVCIAVTNGEQGLESLRDLTEQAVRRVTPGWRMIGATQPFTVENAADQLAVGFESVTCVRPDGVPPVVLRDPTPAADFVASWASFYQDQTDRPWPDVVDDVRQQVRDIIDRDGVFTTSSEVAAFVCR